MGQKDRRFELLQDLLEQLLDQPAAQRAGFIQRVSANDPDLGQELERLASLVPLEARLVAAEQQQGPVVPTAAEELYRRLRESGPFDRERFERLERVGGGGQGNVYRVIDRRLGRVLAMKQPILIDDSSSEAHWRRTVRFLQEAQVHSQLEHPGIVSVHELVVDRDGHPCLLMQFVSGRTADREVLAERGKGLAWRTRALEVMLRVCDAVAYAHQRGVLHRDLKPHNVMIGEFGRVYVMDWGSAKVMDAPDHHDLRIRTDTPSYERDGSVITMDGRNVGTANYMPPEQAIGELLDERADVYSIGAMLYELLSGLPPYQSEGEQLRQRDVLRRVIAGPPTPLAELADVPPALIAIVECAMARRAEQRYADAQQLAAELRAFLDGRTIRAYRAGLLWRMARWVQRHRVIAGAAGATLSIVLLAIYGVRAHAASLQDEIVREVPRVAATLRHQQRLEVLLQRAAELQRVVHSQAVDDVLEREFLPTSAGFPWGVRRRLRALAHTRRLFEQRGRMEWQRVSAELSRDSRFAGFDIDVVPDLVPLGRHPKYDLQFFWHPASGAEPRVGPHGDYMALPETGCVFVLLPPGTYWRGTAAISDLTGSDPFAIWAYLEEWRRSAQIVEPDCPLVEVSVEPFFLSIWELTQGQWRRMAGDDPSKFRPGVVIEHEFDDELMCYTADDRHPVENVSAIRARSVLAMFGWQLPSESQWEYGYRADSSARWASASDAPESMFQFDAYGRVFANVADAARVRVRPTLAPLASLPFDDGFPFHAPVDAFRPNAWGLQGMPGNVWEWSEDVYRHDYRSILVGDLPITGGSRSCQLAVRGGAYTTRLRTASATDRWRLDEWQSEKDVGIRPCLRATWK